MKFKLLGPLFYFGLFFLTIGTLFKIQHWPYGKLCQLTGEYFELLFFILIVVEIIGSKKITLKYKIGLASSYIAVATITFLIVPAIVLIFVIFLLGTMYLKKVRRSVLFTRTDLLKNDFDLFR